MKKLKLIKYLLPIGLFSVTTPLLLTSCSNKNDTNGFDLSNYDSLRFKLNHLELNFLSDQTHGKKQYVIVPTLFENISEYLETSYNAYSLNLLEGTKVPLKDQNILMSMTQDLWSDKTWFIETFSPYAWNGLNKITFKLFYEDVDSTSSNSIIVKSYNQPIIYTFKKN